MCLDRQIDMIHTQYIYIYLSRYAHAHACVRVRVCVCRQMDKYGRQYVYMHTIVYLCIWMCMYSAFMRWMWMVHCILFMNSQCSEISKSDELAKQI